MTGKGEWKPKASYFYMATFKNRLKGYRFSREVVSGNPNVRVYEFDGPERKKAQVLWCTTSTDKHVSAFKVPGLTSGAILVTLEKGSLIGHDTELRPGESLSVSETPTIVLLGNGSQ